ncbi:MAG: hypothetical protein HS122_12265 [Opitutaceae bacterium]|nr:hypothetical protein [Opitutaceae bacterium]
MIAPAAAGGHTYSLVSLTLGEVVQLNNPASVADYLRSAFDEKPMQEAF